jgi:hypothetical protein
MLKELAYRKHNERLVGLHYVCHCCSRAPTTFTTVHLNSNMVAVRSKYEVGVDETCCLRNGPVQCEDCYTSQQGRKMYSNHCSTHTYIWFGRGRIDIKITNANIKVCRTALARVKST